MTTIPLTPEQLINLILTVVIAVAVLGQAWFTRRQAQLLEVQSRLLAASDRREREREKPAVRITSTGHSSSHTGPSGDLTTQS